MPALIAKLRSEYLREICHDLLAYRQGTEVPNIADGSSRVSVDLAKGLVAGIGRPIGQERLTPQTLGERFPKYTLGFLKKAFAKLKHLRPGNWQWSVGQASAGIACFDQYEHLARLQKLVNENPELRAAIGGEYLVIPDLVVSRRPVSDAEINVAERLVDDMRPHAALSPLRETNVPGGPSILHASISCKWTMRSDRAQNTRTEALNLIRTRKGCTPHIVVVTMEPLPSRLASIALGTGDVDCVYHAALYELEKAAEATSHEDAKEMLKQLIEQRRLRDISDLPLDLAV